MKAVVAAFNQEKALVGAFSVITNLRMDLFEALVTMQSSTQPRTLFGDTYEANILVASSIALLAVLVLEFVANLDMMNIHQQKRRRDLLRSRSRNVS